MMMNRRQFISTGVVAAGGCRFALARAISGSEARATISFVGKLSHECSVPGETRADGVFPAHPNGIRLSKDRFLFLYATRGWRGVDEDRSIIYQVRAGGFDGPVLNEGALAKSSDNWDPFGDGSRYFKAHGHPCGFGVPMGAVIDGRLAPNNNLFVISWYNYARYFVSRDRLALTTSDPKSVQLSQSTMHLQWVQVRLNEAQDDIEIVEPVSTLRAPGFADGDSTAERFNQSYVQAVPFRRDATEWLHMVDMGWSEKPGVTANGPVAAKFRYNSSRHRYEWVETGPRLFPRGLHVSGGGALNIGEEWAVFAVPNRHLGLSLPWVRTSDPFSGDTEQVINERRAGQPIVRAPLTGYRCADGRIRVFSGDSDASPYANRRNPLFCWEADPAAQFALSRRQTVVDLLASDLGMRVESEPIADLAKVLPHSGGNSQFVAYRVRTESINYDRIRKLVPPGNRYHRSPAVTEAERNASGIYLARIDYDRDFPDEWEFISSGAAEK